VTHEVAGRSGRGPLVRLLVARIAFVRRDDRNVDVALLVSAACFAAAAIVHAATEPSLLTATLVALTAIALASALVVRVFATVLAVAVLGVALGVASLVTVLAVTRGFEYAIVERLTSLNGHVLVSEYGLDFDEHDQVAARLLEDPRVHAAAPFAWGIVAYARIESHEAVDAVDAVEQTMGDATERESERESERDSDPVVGMIKGVDPAHSGEFRGFTRAFVGCTPQAGLQPAQPHSPPTIALGRELARRLGVTPGEHVRVVSPTALDGTQAPLAETPRAATFLVSCLLDTGLSEFDERLGLVHLTAAQALLFGEGRVTGIELELGDASDAVAVARDAEAALHRLPISDPTLPPRFRAGSWVDQVGGVLDLVRQIRTVVSLILTLLLVVAGAALVSALLLLVRRHTRLLAVLGMLGAPPRVAFLTFETVGVLAGIVGSGLGALLGGVLVAAVWRVRLPLAASVYPIDHLPVRLGVTDFAWPMGAALLVCALVSGPIAWSAVRRRGLEASAASD